MSRFENVLLGRKLYLDKSEKLFSLTLKVSYLKTAGAVKRNPWLTKEQCYKAHPEMIFEMESRMRRKQKSI